MADFPDKGPYQSLDDIIDGFTALEAYFRANRDRRAIFTTAYLVITEATRRNLETDLFHDGEWLTRYAVTFANLYRAALLSREGRDATPLPKAWRIAFDAAANNSALMIQDLTLGISAHINRDLPFVLKAIGMKPHDERFPDFITANAVLREATEPMEKRVLDLYAPGIQMMAAAARPLTLELTSFSVEKARDQAWTWGLALSSARTRLLRNLLDRAIDDSSAVLARLILRPTLEFPLLVPMLRRLEETHPWWEVIPAAADILSMPDALNTHGDSE